MKNGKYCPLLITCLLIGVLVSGCGGRSVARWLRHQPGQGVPNRPQRQMETLSRPAVTPRSTSPFRYRSGICRVGHHRTAG